MTFAVLQASLAASSGMFTQFYELFFDSASDVAGYLLFVGLFMACCGLIALPLQHQLSPPVFFKENQLPTALLCLLAFLAVLIMLSVSLEFEGLYVGVVSIFASFIIFNLLLSMSMVSSFGFNALFITGKVCVCVCCGRAQCCTFRRPLTVVLPLHTSPVHPPAECGGRGRAAPPWRDHITPPQRRKRRVGSGYHAPGGRAGRQQGQPRQRGFVNLH